jgi:hypothetical protein
VNISNTVEQKMCSNQWTNIEYAKTPSLAMGRYTKAFAKHDNTGFTEYLEKLKKGETKVNAGAVYPYNIVQTMEQGSWELANEQWKSLPNFMEGTTERILPVVDVSGSMSSKVSGSISCLDVAVSLGLYISERNEGEFKDSFITFSESPKLEKVSGTLKERYYEMIATDWGMSTNLEKVFNLILTQAKNNNISEEFMPTKILILSDMQFNQATRRDSLGAQSMIEEMYKEAGYKMPNVVYWNLNSSGGNFPVEFDKNGTALVSGFSPSILKSLLGGKNMTPESIMMDTVNDKRYSVITI